MLRSRTLRIVILVLSVHAASWAAPSSPTPLLDQGPLGTRLHAVAPTMLASVETQLQVLLGNGQTPPSANDNKSFTPIGRSPLQGYVDSTRRQDTPKGDAVSPSPAERRQLEVNPAFAKAFAKDPLGALRLLRRVNIILQDAQN
ncbi:hypothetical protein [Acidisphaera sp. S103]|uniref:hypothetical protein n=1 Tax=Acidisphaera sp. S103 TaxID=1747223 RepID=UPI00131D61DD|nr:hypothetical protein [Acidisphaera sp. S103]